MEQKEINTLDALLDEIDLHIEGVKASPDTSLPRFYQLRDTVSALLLRTSEAKKIPMEDCPLSPRELEVLIHASNGQPSKEIAYLMDITQRTVQFHMSSIFKKLNVGSRTEAVAKAIESGWLSN